MVTKAIYVSLKPKPGKEQEVEAFLKSALPLVEAEPGTISWYAFKEMEGHYSIVDTFEDDAGRDAHLNGKVAQALMAKADELFATPPQIMKIEILASKLPK